MICFNGKIIKNAGIDPLQDRAFCYGDGLFETIKIENEQILFFDYHFERLEKGLKILGFQFDSKLKNSLKNHISETLKASKLSDARAKLILWRKSGGLYAPTHLDFNFLISCDALKLSKSIIESIGIAQTIKIAPNELSNLKTLNSLPYVMAGIEKTNRNLDELILINTENILCEASNSNIFWEKDGDFFTPSLDCGCIDGIGRRVFIEKIKNEKRNLIEGKFTAEDLKLASEIYFTNAIQTRKLVSNAFLI
jgi:4-amino-4-deoxychorismate lyase